ncbi:S26 family signal peptidase [Alkalitalea saponilacus]|uniref:Signal peptidase I n=1 Tax=Alkalitalea saponilacus TaxID=889453 RepID=A0A1T5H4V9_9BACT|nr:S26 family signal peptidase [Alkalitalea saponilacus]SKC15717.1 signal peptidase I [Alkalitalea saponilacus]
MMQNIPLARKIRFAIAVVVYLLTVIWIGNFWLLFGLAVIFDIYITKKVPWDFLKKTKDGKKPAAWLEWIDALVFALVAVYIINIFLFQNYKIPTSSLEKTMLVGDHLFVSKLSYGPRMPMTPIAFPLVQNTFPIVNSPSFTKWPKWDYKRLKGFGKVERDDIVVFNFPTGDTVAVYRTNPDYYITIYELGRNQINQNPSLLEGRQFDSEYELRMFINDLGREIVYNNPSEFGKVLYRPVDRRDNYVKRCVALPGDLFEIRSNQIYINGEPVENPETLQHNHHVITDGTRLNQRFFERLEISQDDVRDGGIGPHYVLPLTESMVEAIETYNFVESISIDEHRNTRGIEQVFPYSRHFPWSRDNYGPVTIPAKGETVELTLENLLLYERIITAYEGNTLHVANGTIFINNEPADSYTFEMDYYFMLGDNRHKSADSRYWGFVPEDHIVGRPILVWLSLNKDKGFPSNIRWNRFFKVVKGD